jgi:hypothetical protein
MRIGVPTGSASGRRASRVTEHSRRSDHAPTHIPPTELVEIASRMSSLRIMKLVEI